jgi:hypothetical protein
MTLYFKVTRGVTEKMAPKAQDDRNEEPKSPIKRA